MDPGKGWARGLDSFLDLNEEGLGAGASGSLSPTPTLQDYGSRGL